MTSRRRGRRIRHRAGIGMREANSAKLYNSRRARHFSISRISSSNHFMYVAAASSSAASSQARRRGADSRIHRRRRYWRGTALIA